ncbi:MAG: glutamate formimidoyltransferase [Proteobacteria bacterium]|nr:glutamate formimidoyltransferase [Pseudomonadota bacterium]
MPVLLECVPNFSEGNDTEVIRRITDRIEAVEGIRLLDVDPGRAANRTVVTFVGPPDAVVKAAFAAIEKAAELIDMRRHSGKHPRIGATDVCPLVPVSGISMEEAVVLARSLAERVGRELQVPVYCYENAAFTEERRDLAFCRTGEYEGLAERLRDPSWKPDFGPDRFNARTGATVIGARDFLVAYNVNLNATSAHLAGVIAAEIREKGRPRKEGINVVPDTEGTPLCIPGTLKACKAIGWYIREYGIAQVSMNLTDISVTPIHRAFEEVCRRAEALGLRVTGSEIVGLVPRRALTEAGRYFLHKQRRSAGVPEEELIRIAIRSLGLNDLKPFVSKERLIEYRIADPGERALTNLTSRAFANEVASESPAPGGGSVAALVGALGSALGSMVAAISSQKAVGEGRWREFSDWAEKGQQLKEALLELVDEDTRAFKRVMDTLAMPKKTDEEKTGRAMAVEGATRYAMEVPLQVMEKSLAAMDLLRAMAEEGNPASVTDAGVGALCARTAVIGAFMNIRINAAAIRDKVFAGKLLERGTGMVNLCEQQEEEIRRIVGKRLEGKAVL